MMEDKDKLERAFASAGQKLAGSTGKSARGAENSYGAAYQQLVKAGYRPQLRLKYRVQKG